MTRKVRPQHGAVVEREVPMARSIGLRSHTSSRGDILSIGSGRRIPEIRDSPSNGVEGRRLLSAPELLLTSGKFLTQKTVRNSYQILCEELKATIPEVSFSRTSAQECSCINLRKIHHGLILSKASTRKFYLRTIHGLEQLPLGELKSLTVHGGMIRETPHQQRADLPTGGWTIWTPT